LDAGKELQVELDAEQQHHQARHEDVDPGPDARVHVRLASNSLATARTRFSQRARASRCRSEISAHGSPAASAALAWRTRSRGACSSLDGEYPISTLGRYPTAETRNTAGLARR
jgi:hypothetical protein